MCYRSFGRRKGLQTRSGLRATVTNGGDPAYCGYLSQVDTPLSPLRKAELIHVLVDLAHSRALDLAEVGDEGDVVVWEVTVQG